MFEAFSEHGRVTKCLRIYVTDSEVVVNLDLLLVAAQVRPLEVGHMVLVPF